MFRLPKTATAPFCPAEVKGTVFVPPDLKPWKKALRFAGPGLLVSVGYMDPGNWATDIQAGSAYGYDLLFVVLLSSLAAIVLQCLSARLGLVTGKDLAVLSRQSYGPRRRYALWAMAELAIVATDLAEVLGSALAFKLLLGVSLPWGVMLTMLDTLIVLGLKGAGFRRIEAIILGLVSTIGLCFLVELSFVPTDWHAVASGFVPSLRLLSNEQPLYLAIGILGATVMPHNLYLHSSIVQTRIVKSGNADVAEAVRLVRTDTIASLLLALIVNAAILILAGSAFHYSGHNDVADIEDAYHLLDPIAGTAAAGVLFGLALFASGQSSTFTGTIAGQVILEGFLQIDIPCWQRRLITRGLALGPALAGVLLLGEHAVGRMLVLSQVVLSLQLPFAMWPLIRFSGNRDLMGDFANTTLTRLTAWTLFAVISAANVWLVLQVTGVV
ncbi:MAG TPA: Nramp family divalent metal transporter [Alphaproteobacteria bacterium]|jgi:manganese transport protein|nr:Nramp family divalent metal transporter [Alphaproteobacteria bacterium]